MTDQDRYHRGMAVRRSVLGDKHVDRAESTKNDFDQDFQAFITRGAWGDVWDRETLSLRERSMITISLLAALGHDEEVAMHIRACHNTGATMDDIKEVMLHVAVYAGVPAANRGIKIAKSVMAEDRAEGNSSEG